MATSEVEIVNSAFVKLGAELIISLTENNKRARLANEQYPKIRDDMLSIHPWNFAVTRKELAATANVPSFEFAKEYELPSDVLRILSTNLNLLASTQEVPWAVEHSQTTGNRVLVTDAEVVNIRYLKRVTDVTKYPPYFVETFATRLAAEFAYALTQSTTRTDQLLKIYLTQLRDARSFDAQEGSLQQVDADDWLVSRF